MIRLKRPKLSNKWPERPKGKRGPATKPSKKELEDRQEKLSKELATLEKSDKDYAKKVGEKVDKHWSNFRSADGKRTDSVIAALRQMSFDKCCYCERTAANNIDHFWPKAKYPEKTFAWTNLFLACSTCNDSSHKGDELEIIGSGSSIHSKLLDPSTLDDDPYRFFMFTVHKNCNPPGEPERFNPIGWIEPRPAPETEAYERARHTIEKLELNPPLYLARAMIIDYFFKLCSALVEFGPDYVPEPKGTGETVRQTFARLLSRSTSYLGPLRQILRDKPELRKELIAQMPELAAEIDAWDLEHPSNGSSSHT